MLIAATLLAATLLGGMVFFSFGFAPVLFKQLPSDQVRPILRGTFPYYYAAVIFLSAATTIAASFIAATPALLCGAIFLSTIYARQILMPQINAASDAEDKKKFGQLHGLSVVIQLIQIALAAWALIALIPSL